MRTHSQGIANESRSRLTALISAVSNCFGPIVWPTRRGGQLLSPCRDVTSSASLAFPRQKEASADKHNGSGQSLRISTVWRQQIFNCILWALLLYLLERLFIFKLAAFCATASGCHRVSTFFLFLPRPATNAMLSDDYNKKQRSERKRKENNT